MEKLKGCAILLILLDHFHCTYPSSFLPRLLRHGWAGVDLLFVISGFLATHSLLKVFPKDYESFDVVRKFSIFKLISKSFLIKSFFRTVPLVITYLSLTLFFSQFFNNAHVFGTPEKILRDIAYTFTFRYSYTAPYLKGDTDLLHYFYIISHWYFISAFLFLFFIFPNGKSRKKAILFLAVFFGVVFRVFPAYSGPSEWDWVYFRFSPHFNFVPLFLGVAIRLSNLIWDIRITSYHKRILEALAITSLLAIWILPGILPRCYENPFLTWVIWGFSCLLVAIAAQTRGLFVFPFGHYLEALGKRSFSIYLAHPIIPPLASEFLLHFKWADWRTHGLIAFILYVALILLTTELTQRIVEIPYTRFGRLLYFRCLKQQSQSEGSSSFFDKSIISIVKLLPLLRNKKFLDFLVKSTPIFGIIITCLVIFPGYLDPDTVWVMSQAQDNIYSNWNPPIMGWVWRQLLRVPLFTGPSGLFLLNTTLFWFGLFWCLKVFLNNSRKAALATLGIGLYPPILAMNTFVTKNNGHVAALLISVAILIKGTKRPKLALGIAALPILYSWLVRHNGPLTAIPLLCYSVWTIFPSAKITKKICISFGLFCGFFFAGNLINYKLTDHESYPGQIVFTFDLAGISVDQNVNLFPSFMGTNISELHRWYRDYSAWYLLWHGAPDAQIPGFVYTLPTKHTLLANWIAAIITYPKSYIKHRLAFSYKFLGFNSWRGFGFWHFHEANNSYKTWVQSSYLNKAFLNWVVKYEDSNFFLNFIYFSLLSICGFGTILLSHRLKLPYTERTRDMWIFASGFGYHTSYFIFGISTALIYSFWSIVISLLFLARFIFIVHLYLRNRKVSTPFILVCNRH